jgi:hypothetical protein
MSIVRILIYLEIYDILYSLSNEINRLAELIILCHPSPNSHPYDAQPLVSAVLPRLPVL